MKTVVLNWKAYILSKAQALNLLHQTIQKASLKPATKFIIAPPYIYLDTITNTRIPKNICLASQDISEHTPGAHTSHITATMLKNLGITYTLIGHSETREKCTTTQTIIQKITRSLENGITPIYLFGEKDPNNISDTLSELQEVISYFPEQDLINIIFGYEPVWAISTNNPSKQPSLQNIPKYKELIPNNQLFYGGSVSENNINQILSNQLIEGVIIGSASVKITTNHLIENI